MQLSRNLIFSGLLIGLSTVQALGLQRETGEEIPIREVNLPPSAFSQLPKHLQSALEAMQCVIPQTYESTVPHNVIQGEFEKRGKKDWAVVCVRNGISSIIVFWNGSVKKFSEISAVPYQYGFQLTGRGAMEYSRYIHIVGEKFIADHHAAYGGPKPPPIDHDAIDDLFLDKASVVHYYHQGTWLELTGSD